MSIEKSLRKTTHEIYGSFFLHDSEIALPVTHVQEVVNSPDRYTSLPLSQPYLKGLLNLRGSIIPVVDLRKLMNLPERVSAEIQKIAILELDGGCVGLLFDRTGEIFRSNEDEKSEFISESHSQIVSGVFKKNEGKRIVQILNVNGLFKLKGIPRDEAAQRGRNRLQNKRGHRKQCISFVVGPAKCAMGIEAIQEILKIEKVSESALGGGHCIGTIDLRGITVPVVDFASLLRYRDTDRTDEATRGDRRIVVMRTEKELFGLMVDSVDSIVSYFPDEMIAFPIIDQSRADMFIGCITAHNSSDILLLNHQNILTNSEISEITHGHAKLYSNDTGSNGQNKKSNGGARRTYITFAVGGSYAIGINEVKEIIDYPKNLLQPPGLPDHFRGVLNLRGELVTIVDARSMYSAKPSEKTAGQEKVLIFKKDSVHFGLIVDAVESIVSYSNQNKIQLPETLYLSGNSGITQDVVEAVQVTNDLGEINTLLILSADSIAGRIGKAGAA